MVRPRTFNLIGRTRFAGAAVAFCILKRLVVSFRVFESCRVVRVVSPWAKGRHNPNRSIADSGLAYCGTEVHVDSSYESQSMNEDGISDTGKSW